TLAENHHRTLLSLLGLLELRFQFAGFVQRWARSEVFKFKKLSNLDFRIGIIGVRSGYSLRPFDRFFSRLRIDDPVTVNQLLGLGKGTVDDRGLAAGVTYSETLRAGLKPRCIEEDACLYELLVVLRHC